MSRIIVIGGTDHIRTHLVPALVDQGHDVISVSRGLAKSYVHNTAWDRVEQVTVDRQAEERTGTFVGV